MPNLCFNSLQVQGEEEDVALWVERAASADTPEALDCQPLRFEAFVPPPAFLEPDSGEAISWRCANWGTKWDAIFEEIDSFALSRSKGQAIYKFDTAWSPPLEWIARVARDYPRLCFRLVYGEEGDDFGGEIVFAGGAVQEEREGRAREFIG